MRAARKNHSAMNRLSCRGWWSMQDASCPDAKKGRDGETPFDRLHGKRPTQEFVPFGEKVLAKHITTDPMNRMNPRYQYGIWLGMRNNIAVGECRWCVPSSRNQKIGTSEQMGHRSRQQCDWEVPWRLTDGKWTVDRPEVRVDPVPIPPLQCEGARIQRE